MTLEIELTAEDELRLRAEADARGITPVSLAAEMLRSLLRGAVTGSASPLLPVVDAKGVFHQDRWDAVMRSIARGSANATVLSAEALTRESMYEDRD